MEHFADYSHALAAMGFWSILVSVLAGVSTRGRSPEGRCACGKPKRNYDDPVYRAERAFMNAVEVSGPFLAATIAAILVGAAPFWVNLLASVFILARLAMAYVHIKTTNQAMRSAFFAIGFLCVFIMALFTIFAAFLG